MIRIQNVTPDSPNHIFSKLSIALETGKIHAILCTNMTALDELALIFSRRLPLKSGSILLGGYNLNEPSVYNHVDVILKAPMLFEKQSVAENIFITHSSFGIFKRAGIQRQCKKLFDTFQYHQNVGTPIGQLSLEQQKIIELFRSYVNSPQILVLHETANAMSTLYTNLFQKLLDEIHASGTTVIFLTSKWEDAIASSDSVTVLSRGENKGTFSSEEVLCDPRNVYALSMGGQSLMMEYNRDFSRQNSVLELISESADLLSTEAGIHSALNRFAQKISETLEASYCAIYLLDESNKNIIDLVEYYSQTTPAENYRLSIRAVGALALAEDFVYLNSNDKQFSHLFGSSKMIKALLGNPIRLRGNVVGFVEVCFQNYYVYAKEDTTYLSAVTSEIALIIENTRLAGKSLLLQESHHRIKNNLQMIISLMQMQKHTIEHKLDNKQLLDEVNATIDATISRVKSISTIHDIISKEATTGLINIKQIIQEIQKFYSFSAEINIDTTSVLIPHNTATSLALIINELINNSIRHAPPNHFVEIFLTFSEEEDNAILQYKDNGNGYPPDFSPEGNTTIGMTILTSIVTSEFGGELKFYNDNGACVRISFPKFNFL